MDGNYSEEPFFNMNGHALGFAACYQRDARIEHELFINGTIF